MALYGEAQALGVRFRAPREGSYERQAERVSMGPNTRELDAVRRTNAGIGLRQHDGAPRRASKNQARAKRRVRVKALPGRAKTPAVVSRRRQLLYQLRDNHRSLAHAWAEAASRLHAQSRLAFANGEPAAELYDTGLLAEAESAYHLRQVSALDEAMRATYPPVPMD